MSAESSVTTVLRQPLQEVFDSNCQAYEIHLDIYKKISNIWKMLNDKEVELKEKQELEEKMSKMKELLNSHEFNKLKAYAFLSTSETESFVKQFSAYVPDNALEGDIADNEYEKEALNRILRLEKETLIRLKINLFILIGLAYDAGVQLVFPRKNAIAERIFVFYFQDDDNFKNMRKVIQLEGCKLRRDFLKAYTASTEKEKEEALQWFKAETEKIKI